MTGSAVRVLVLYSHPLLGEGMSCMLAAEEGLEVTAVDVSAVAERDAALAHEPDVIVLEEGGSIDAAEILRRTSCHVVIDVDISSAEAFTFRRSEIHSRPDDIVAAIRQAIGTEGRRGGRHAAHRSAALPS